MRRRKTEMERTANSTVYRRYRKEYLEMKGKIYCSRCKYHRGENKKIHYGGFIEEGQELKDADINYPSWKLASKNPKQWMPKNRVKMEMTDPFYSYYKKKNWKYVSFSLGNSHIGIKYGKR